MGHCSERIVSNTMKNILIDKLKSWTIEKSDMFHSHIVRDDIEGKYIWEYDVNGIFLLRNNGCHYLSNDGKVFILTSAGTDEDFTNHVKLYNQITSCRIDIPITQEIVYVNEIKFFYKEFRRPNNEFGRDYHLDIFDNLVDDQYLLEYIIDTKTILNELKLYGGLVPKVGMSPFKRLRDSEGIFFSDFKDWSITFEDYVKTSLNTLEIVMFYLNENKLTNLNTEMILQEAKTQWNIQ